MNDVLARTLYALLFLAALPAALVAWAVALRPEIHLTVPDAVPRGIALASGGIVIILLGMLALWSRGGGLPMNAFPPPRFVREGVYAVVPHPIYGGFILLCGGASIAFGSPGGFWLLTPTVALACAALVIGYEQPDLQRRFGSQASLGLLASQVLPPLSLRQRLRVGIAVLLPWLAFYGMIWYLGRPTGAISSYFPFESHLPVIPWTEAIYASTYIVVLLTPFLVRTVPALREFAQRGIIAILLILPIYLFLPVFVPPRPFVASTPFGHLLAFEQTPYSGAAAFPSFHVVWAFVAASALGRQSRFAQWFWWAWAVAVAISCVTTGMHSILDVLAGAACFWLILCRDRIWKTLLASSERIANSWREWRMGPVRIINHGAYAGLAAAVGIALISMLLPTRSEIVLVSIYSCAILGAALWAQWVEGSPSLLRPLGFYGGMIGASIGVLPALFLGINLWTVLASISFAAPWIQAIGRVRCLVQGCCHGRPTRAVQGIRYTHPRSRVCRLAHLSGTPVHATPLYSILWNLWTGLALLRLVSLHVAPAMVAGIYLILSGAGRFVEEAYRGEPQTKRILGLPIYQWIAVLTIVAGAAMTAVHTSINVGPPEFRSSVLPVAVACGIATWFVAGVDFPESSRRFARLA